MDALIDPSTRDYTGASTHTLANAVYIRVTTPLGSYWAAPTIGSKLHLLSREKDTPRIRLLAAQYAEQALQPLIDSGRASALSVSSATGETGWLILLIDITDASGKVQHFEHPVKVA